jgi:hypothetical protein
MNGLNQLRRKLFIWRVCKRPFQTHPKKMETSPDLVLRNFYIEEAWAALLSQIKLSLDTPTNLYAFLAPRSSLSLDLIRSVDLRFERNDWAFDATHLLTQRQGLDESGL